MIRLVLQSHMHFLLFAQFKISCKTRFAFPKKNFQPEFYTMFQAFFSVIAVVLHSNQLVVQLKEAGRFDTDNHTVVAMDFQEGSINVTSTVSEAEDQVIGFKTKVRSTKN